ncbi:hypothetical protein H9X86_10065 [Pseudoflavonifractor capillosus]|uniref:hypothetical protein n=1 Tax=Pseudoflavonifractor capillosus TaxID=106588 RepID=UPI00195E877D|nr:hypothetical protein [Pseudoflavonifractor capillosus]MBM6897698.1 hypothetical protein [Pseudoflavonifractor capillosus]
MSIFSPKKKQNPFWAQEKNAVVPPSVWPCFAKQMGGRPPLPALCAVYVIVLSEARPQATLYAIPITAQLNPVGEELAQASISHIYGKVQYFLSLPLPGVLSGAHLSLLHDSLALPCQPGKDAPLGSIFVRPKIDEKAAKGGVFPRLVESTPPMLGDSAFNCPRPG